ncbi:uncharacterized protein LOC125031236 [Penaeus chinensis]|uniref:uncharacterized protein LOC125031236 n=1 Tax=Penaeus chinensis TaxID=139456 RepID=UPI001FB66D4B|nr:uncharacterized protein LOC125031236 [Penaeus chinensis]
MAFSSLALFLLLVLLAGATEPEEVSRLTVSLSSPHCKQVDSSFSCDFKNIEEPVFLDELPTPRTSKVFLHNAGSVTVAAKVCIHLAFFGVSSITFDRNSECPTDAKTSLRLVDSGANLVPRHVIRLDMEDSSATVLDTEAEMVSLNLLRSSLGVLHVPKPFRANTIIKLEHSTISSIDGLVLEGSQLLMINTTVDTIKRHGIQLRDSSGSIWLGSFKETYDQALLLGAKSTLTLKGIDGKITLAGSEEASSLRHIPTTTSRPSTTNPPSREPLPPGVPPKNVNLPEPPCPRGSSIFWLLPTGLALVEAMIILVNCTNWFPALKGGRLRRGVEEGGRSTNTLEGVATAYNPIPAFYYSNEPTGFSSMSMRNRHDKAA